MKNYAVETVTPTLERVDRVKSYSTEKLNIATSYGKEKIDGRFGCLAYFCDVITGKNVLLVLSFCI